MAGIDVRGIGAPELPEEPFPSQGHEFRIHVSQTAFDKITTHGTADTTREVGGVLVGRVCRDAGGPYVSIESAIDALHAEEKGTELTFTHATWDHVHREMEARHKGAAIVGWYHTHPSFGIFLSDRDEFIHRSFFNLPSQVALVFDPVSREHGLFAWRENEPVRVRRWWIGDREHIWDGAHPPKGVTAPPPKEEVPMERPGQPAAAAPPDYFTLAFSALFVLVLGGIGGWWYAQSATHAALREAQAAIAEERVKGMGEAVRGLNVDLLTTLRRALDTNVRSAAMDAALADVDAATKALEPLGDSAKEPAARLAQARLRLTELRDASPRVASLLDPIEKGLRAGAPDPAEMAKALREQGQVLGQLCAMLGESAARQGDANQARRFFSHAARCDPAGADAYAKRLASLTDAGPK